MTPGEVDDSCSVQVATRRAVDRYGSRPAVGLPNQLQSFNQTYDRSLRLGAALGDLGAAPGTRIALLAGNGPWYFELYFACCEFGFVEVPINGRFTPGEQRRHLAAIGPEILLVSAENATRASELQKAVPTIRHVIGIDEGHGLGLDYERLLAGARPSQPSLRDVDELVLISATSGTSGDAKAVMHSQRTTASAYAPLMERFGIGDDSRFVTGLAMYFATAYAGWTASFMAGAQQTLLPSFSPTSWVEIVEKSAATHGFLGPTPVNMIMDAGIDLRRLGRLRYLSMGGAASDPTRLRALAATLGSRVALQFSMTELGAGTVLLGSEFVTAGGLGPRHRSVGLPVRGLQARVVGGDGNPLPPGADLSGDLQVRGPMVSPGHLDDGGNPTAGPGEWFDTGDVAAIDADGFVFIVDRRKDLIVSGGINIAPSEIERALLAHPAVSAAGVCGVPDRVYGEGVHAAVTLRPGADASAEELMTWCRAHLASVKKPRSIVFVDELPVSSTGKLLRRVLRERYTEA